MDNKLSELSKPVAWKLHYYGRGHYFEESAHVVAMAESMRKAKGDALYSQEYVSALLADRDAFEASALAMRDEWRARGERIAELEQAMRHIHSAALDITVPRAAIAKAAEFAAEHAAKKEQSNG